MRQRTMLCGLLLATLLPFTPAPAIAAAGDVEDAIQAALVEKLGDGAKPIRVAFYDGKAVLSGRVAEQWVQELAKEVALWVPGVARVENEVEATDEKSVGAGKLFGEGGDAALESAVKKAVHDEVGTHSSSVEIEACDGAVSLRGTLPDAARRDLALAAARKVRDVTRVVDLLRVAG